MGGLPGRLPGRAQGPRPGSARLSLLFRPSRLPGSAGRGAGWPRGSGSACEGAELAPSQWLSMSGHCFLVWGLPCSRLPKEAGTLSLPSAEGPRCSRRSPGGCCKGACAGQQPPPATPWTQRRPRTSDRLTCRLGPWYPRGGSGPLRPVASAAQTVPQGLCPPPQPETPSHPPPTTVANEAW